MSVNTDPTNATQIQNSSQGPFVFTNSLFSASTQSNCSFHKSFDFSNININSSPYKQYHQTRIYIQDFDRMTSGGSNLGNKNSTYIISSNLPDSFNYGIGSEWGNPLSDIFKGVGNLLMQVTSSAMRAQNKSNFFKGVGNNITSGINRAANFLIWSGAKPLQIQLKIPVLDDNDYQNQCGNVRTNLKEALEFLGCLCLPRLDGELGFYTPAPSSLALTIKKRKEDQGFSFSPNHARIMVQIGGMLFIDNCIIKSVAVNYPNTRSLMRREDGSLTPILAEVTISITTIETLTSDTFTKMLWLRQQKDQGKGEFAWGDSLDTAMAQGKQAGSELLNVGKIAGGALIDGTKNLLGIGKGSMSTSAEASSNGSPVNM